MGEQPRTAPGEEEWAEQTAVRAAWCYYMLGMTQAQVAERLGLPRMRVNRLLAEARERGVVSISINSALTENIELEEALRGRFGLESAHVAMAPPPIADREDPQLAELLGRVAAPVVAGLIAPDMVIGAGWGMTLRALGQALQPMRPRGISVVSLIGSLNRRSAIDAFEATTLLAHKLSAECYYLAGPFICDSPATRAMLTAQPVIAEPLALAARADLAVVSVGGHSTGTVAQIGLVEPGDMAELAARGSVGNFLGYFIDARAAVIDHPVNERVIGLAPETLRGVAHRLMVSGGPLKLPALRAVLEARLVTALVTDQDSARRLLAG